jgi:hypothetical protein
VKKIVVRPCFPEGIGWVTKIFFTCEISSSTFQHRVQKAGRKSESTGKSGVLGGLAGA